MRKAISAALVLLASTLAVTTGRSVEDTWDNSVRATSTVQASPAKITINWLQDERYAPSSYTVYRRLPGAASWGTGTVLSGSTTSYVDSNVAPGTAYEYRIVKATSAYPGYGYIQTGINVPLVEGRGKVVLVVDSTYAANLSTELNRLQSDLTGDGWTVLRHDVSRTASVPSVKAIIKSDYTADPANVKSVFLFGHVPVPYSGQLNPDGHPEHTGAWPADVYYGDMDGTWTDTSVNYQQTANTNPAERTRLSNVPGDGKFDQTTIPSTVELQVGRVDLSNMPGLFYTGGPTTFPSELELLRQYLNKDHNFRHRVINPQRRAVVADYFGWRNGETFSSSAYGAFAAFFGPDKTLNLNVAYNDTRGVWVPELAKNDYLCAFGAGAGSYGSIAGLGNGAANNTALTTEIVNNNVRAVFTLLFGSWNGDWDSQDNFMRGLLATKDYGLAAAWSGRPHWFIHPMGLGEPIGYTARLAQNNKGDYQNQVDSSRNMIHIALMGDPTLRLHVVAPVSSLTGSVNGSVATLTWAASADTVLGYHVYRATSANGPFTRLTSSLVTGTSFTDSNSTAGATYMVRAVKLESTPSGSYENASQGLFWTTGGTSTPPTGDTSAPSVSLTSPSGGSTVSGSSVAVSATAADNVGVAGVQFKLDGANLGAEDTASPYSVTWNTTSVANGSHTLTAVARDAAGNTKTSTVATVTVSNTTTTPPTTPPPTTTTGWVDDALPAGATGYGSEAWNWVTTSPAPVSGTKAHQSALASGLHEHALAWASSPMAVATGDTVYAYVYIDPANVPAEIMVHWYDGSSWDHRAYWGANNITYGTDGTASRLRVGALPAAGQWVRLEVPASSVGLAGKSVTGMAFSAYNGRVTWDNAGTSAQGTTTPPTPAVDATAPTVSLSAPATGSTVSGSSVAVSATAADNVGVVGVQFKLDGANFGAEDTTAPYSLTWNTTAIANGSHSLAAVARDAAGNKTTSTNVSVTVSNTTPTTPPPAVTPGWVDDALPAGSTGYGSEAWNWVTSPTPVSGSKAHQSALASGLHEHAFAWASTPMSVATGDTLYAYVYIDPANVPAEIMVHWNDGSSWNHRAYWGANNINYGTDGTASRFRVGALPAAGQWVRLQIPASAVGLAGKNVTGMAFSAYNGRVTWDNIGTSSSSTTTPTPTVDTTAPTVSLSAPATSSTVSGSSVAVSATAADNVGITGVQFKLDGANLGSEDTTAPYSVTWNTTAASNASHTLSAVARDAAGNTKTAANVSVTVSNVTTTPPVTDPTTPPVTNPPDTTPPGTTTPSPTDVVENAAIDMPKVGQNGLTLLTPTMLELERINTKQPDPAAVDSWNFVSSTGVFTAPATSKFAVTVDGQSVAVQSIGFRRRVRYAPLDIRDLRIGNYLYVQLATPVNEGQTVVVKNPDATLWPATMTYTVKADPLRNSPAIHVNQEGYVPSLPKKAMVGYYLGNLGELNVSAGSAFKLVNAATGATAYQGTLVSRLDTGYNYTPKPYQKVLQADFSGFTTPGEYQLVVPGMGASLPFLINDGIAMDFVRTYALGLYHQRCGASNAMPFTRFTHDACHTAPAEVPSPQSSYQFTWTTIAGKNADTTTTDPAGVGPQLKDEASQLYPFVNKGTVNVSGGHHDAGDYSKYTINVAQLTHLLMFTADSIAGAGALDNLGIPESGDGISDIMQEAKQEADYLTKLQDADGGFYFIVYPKTREYEGNVTPDHGDTQVVWPKNTSATAASVAALAQMASSPKFKAAYPAAASMYLTKAKLGWQFIMNGIAKYGKNGAYQKVTFYGDDWIHNDEIAWAACELFLATGDAQYSQKLMEWFPNPADTNTMRWGWWRMSQCWGNAIRSYAFAARSGRLAASQLNSTYLAACEGQIKAAADDALARSTQNAYGTAFPLQTKNVLGGGWYFSLDMAADMSVAYQINPNAAYLDALVTNMNYEGGSNPVNVTYLTGLGLKRQRETVNQYAKNDRRMLTPSGVPIGNIQASLPMLTNYSASGNELSKLSFPSDGGSTGTYSFYDRWTDTWNVSTEFITVNQARGLMAVASLAQQTSAKSTPWKSATASIVAPTTTVPLNTPVTLSLVTTGLDLTNARIVWEGRDQEPDYGTTFSYTPKNTGAQWAEAEIAWPDGRRVFAVANFTANSPVVTWVEDALPAGANGYGSEAWTWVTSPAPYSGTKAHQSVIAAGLHEHAFNNASSPLVLATGDKLFAYVYLDPANVPTEIMIHWADSNGSWDHRAYWGANSISYGTDGTASRYRVGNLPAAGGWVRLEVPANTVGLAGATVKGMCFSTYGGRATWDAAGKSSL